MHAALSENLCAYQWYTQGNMTCPDGTSSHTWGKILCTTPYIFITNTPYLPVADGVWQGDMGVWM